MLHRFQLLSAGAFKRIQEMQWFRFKVKVRTSRPATRIPAKTNDLPPVVGASGSTNAQMAVASLDASTSQMKCPAQGGAPTTPPDTIVGSSNRTTHAAGDIQRWVVLLDTMGHHTRHRHKQRCEQTQQQIRVTIGRKA